MLRVVVGFKLKDQPFNLTISSETTMIHQWLTPQKKHARGNKGTSSVGFLMLESNPKPEAKLSAEMPKKSPAGDTLGLLLEILKFLTGCFGSESFSFHRLPLGPTAIIKEAFGFLLQVRRKTHINGWLSLIFWLACWCCYGILSLLMILNIIHRNNINQTQIIQMTEIHGKAFHE